MIPYRSFFILQKEKGFLIIDNDKLVVTYETSLNKAKAFIDMIVETECPDLGL